MGLRHRTGRYGPPSTGSHAPLTSASPCFATDKHAGSVGVQLSAGGALPGLAAGDPLRLGANVLAPELAAVSLIRTALFSFEYGLHLCRGRNATTLAHTLRRTS